MKRECGQPRSVLTSDEESSNDESCLESAEDDRHTQLEESKQTSELRIHEPELNIDRVAHLIEYDFRKYFKVESLEQCGGFLKDGFRGLVYHYLNWLDYPKGDRELKGHSSRVTATMVCRDGRYLFTGSFDRSIIKWDLIFNQKLHGWQAHYGPVRCIHLDPKGRLVSGSDDGLAKVWSADNCGFLKSLKGHTSGVNSVSVNDNGDLVVSGSDDCSIRVWSMEQGQCLTILKGHSDGVKSVIFFRTVIMSGSVDRSIREWNKRSGIELGRVGNEFEYTIGNLCLNCDQSLMSCLFYEGFSVLKCADMSVVCVIKVCSYCQSFHPLKPDILAVAVNAESLIRIYRIVNGGECIHSIKVPYYSETYHLCFSPDGCRLISGSADARVLLWDLSEIPLK